MDTLSATVRRIDEDRWLASRFAENDAARARLITIYAVNYEIARTAETVTQGAIGDIRLAWWREALGEIHAGRPPRAHPVLQAYAETARNAAMPLEVWDRLIEARGKDLDAAPFASLAELDAFLDATAGGVIRLALAACAAEAEESAIGVAARAWGLVGFLRSEMHWRARGRSFYPAGVSREELAARAASAHAEAAMAKLSARAFPALGYVALAPGYLRALKHGKYERMLLGRQVTLVAAAARGKL